MYTLNEKIRDLEPYEPIAGEYKIRLDANESFLCLPESVMASALHAMMRVELNRYPDPTAKDLCAAFAKSYKVKPACVAAGNGSDELINVIFQSFLMKGEEFAYILGINYDVTLLERMEGFLGGFLSCQGNLYETMRENGAGTLDTIYDSCAEMMPDIEGKLSRERRQTLIRLLDSQQFFKLQKSIPYLSEKLKVSKYTLYKDMDDLHLR